MRFNISPIYKAAMRTGLLVSAGLLTVAADKTAAQQLEPPRGAAEHQYLGVRRCRLCHDRPADAPGDEELSLTEFVQLNEYRTWREHDAHSRAYEVLEGELARRMGAALAIEPTKEQSCLACHATLDHGRLPDEARRDELQLGVSCESCHGPSSDWFVPHMEASWRTKSSAEKEALGMIDMRNAASRASQCLSCHLGDPRGGKFVTHDMYAAGHPPLSGFEVETFLRAMPPHWQPLAQKSAQVREQVNYDAAQHNAAKSSLVSGLLAMRRSVELLAAQAAAAQDAAPARWPDFAAFDCYACHHDLQSPSWRQQRSAISRPGRPPLHFWPAALVEAGLWRSADNQAAAAALVRQYDERLTRLSAAVAARPFGDAAAIGNPADAASSSGALMALLDEQAQALSAAKIDSEAALAAMRSLCGANDGAAPLRDYASARQVAWALTSMFQELDPNHPNHAAIRKLLQELHAALRLALPNADENNNARQVSSAGIVEQSLPALFETMSDYDPQWFNEQLAAIGALL